MKAQKKTCHPRLIRHKKNKTEITIVLTNQQLGWVQAAADKFTKGCLCDFANNLFFDAFQELTEEIAQGLEDEKHATRGPAN